MVVFEGVMRWDGWFLVYDLGGGIFDVVLVEVMLGFVIVIVYEGINMLGGCDFDWVIVDFVIWLWLDVYFVLFVNVIILLVYKCFFVVVCFKVEQVKVEFFIKQDMVIFFSDEDVCVEDSDGELIYVECLLDCKILEGLIIDWIDDSIDLC